MSPAINVALAFLTAANNAEQAQLEAARPSFTVKVSKEKVISKPRKAKNDGSQAAPIHAANDGNSNEGKMTACGLALPDKGTLDAEGFVMAIRNAGKRMVEGKMVFLPQESRHDHIRAIAAYVGWDNHQLLGAQDSAARMQAQRELCGKTHLSSGPDRQAQRQVDLSAKGFIAGLPAPVASKLSDLQARELVAADNMIAFQKEADDTSRSEYERELSLGLALVESERLAVIREDIKRLSF